MAWRYLKRSREPVLNRAVVEFPAVALTGPRQSGKTTLLKHLFGRPTATSPWSLQTSELRALSLRPIFRTYKNQALETT